MRDRTELLYLILELLSTVLELAEWWPFCGL